MVVAPANIADIDRIAFDLMHEIQQMNALTFDERKGDLLVKVSEIRAVCRAAKDES